MDHCPNCKRNYEGTGVCPICDINLDPGPAPTREETVPAPARGSETLLAVAKEARAIAESYQACGLQMVTYKTLGNAFGELAGLLEMAAASQNDQALRQPPTAAVERKGNDEIQ